MKKLCYLLLFPLFAALASCKKSDQGLAGSDGLMGGAGTKGATGATGKTGATGSLGNITVIVKDTVIKPGDWSTPTPVFYKGIYFDKLEPGVILFLKNADNSFSHLPCNIDAHYAFLQLPGSVRVFPASPALFD